MEITRIFENDYNRYKQVRFTVVDALPEIGSIDDTPGCYRRKVTNIIDVTNSANYCDEGDYGYYSLYKVWYDVEQYQIDTDEDGNDIEYLEPDEPEYQNIAIWTPYEEEKE